MVSKGWGVPRAVLSRTANLAVTLILLLEIVIFYAIPTKEYLPPAPPLQRFETAVGSWRMVRETEIETEVQELLRADATLSRDYDGPEGPVSVFVAFYRTQRAGVTPHSPKVCLPGAGWVQESAEIISLPIPGEPAPIPVNRYIVTHGENRALVLYWYQSAHRVVASEYLSKIYLMADSLRYRRSDVALVRVIVPLEDARPAEPVAVRFIETAYAPLKRQFGF